VTDQGRGIPADMLGRVFDRFFQLERSITRSAGGLGIGLYLVKQLCDRMGAEVLVTSEVGMGSCFTVRFPLA
jgi:signal transduction histidine kinase